MLEKESLVSLKKAVDILDRGFSALPQAHTMHDWPAIESILMQVAEKMTNNYPYFHPCYAGQMLKPPHPVARLAYTLALWLNPNNHALDGGKASSQMEKEAVAEIAGLFGWDHYLGHLTGGGTMANLEALWIAGRLNPGKLVVASQQAHYTHERISEVLQLPFKTIPCTAEGKLNIQSLEKLLDTHDVGTVVATIGTTGTGAVDPLDEIVALQASYGFRLHADGAYGGYFLLADNLSPKTEKAYACLTEADSIVIDPHKHGLQPYGCGCVLFKDPAVGAFYKHQSPYTYFSSSQMHLGEISLECSRPGASAVALWATQKLLPLVKGGAFANNLARTRRAALAFFKKIENDQRFRTLFEPDLDIVVWAPCGVRATDISRQTERLFRAAERRNLYLATFTYPSVLLKQLWPDVLMDQEQVTLLRSCFMKPEHDQWIEHIWRIIDEITVL